MKKVYIILEQIVEYRNGKVDSVNIRGIYDTKESADEALVVVLELTRVFFEKNPAALDVIDMAHAVSECELNKALLMILTDNND